MRFFDKFNKTVKSVEKVFKDISEFAESSSVQTQSTKDILTDYDLSKLKKKDDIYLLNGSNIEKAIADVLYLNLYLQEAPQKHPCFPYRQIKASDLCFKYNIVNGFSQFCFLTFTHLTKTGRQPKYPIVLHFHISPKLFGQIYYGQTAEIDKACIIAWNNDVCCELNLALINGQLDIKTIYKTNPITHKKQKMYYQ